MYVVPLIRFDKVIGTDDVAVRYVRVGQRIDAGSCLRSTGGQKEGGDKGKRRNH